MPLVAPWRLLMAPGTPRVARWATVVAVTIRADLFAPKPLQLGALLPLAGTWSWTGVVVTGDVVLGHVGYKYNNATGTLNGHIVSDSTFGGGGSTVPEPGVLQLLGVGLVGLGVARRRLFGL